MGSMLQNDPKMLSWAHSRMCTPVEFVKVKMLKSGRIQRLKSLKCGQMASAAKGLGWWNSSELCGLLKQESLGHQGVQHGYSVFVLFVFNLF